MTPLLNNWPALLNAYVESRRDTPFAWGTQDCCMFAAGGVQAITGRDFARKFRRRYKTARGAASVLRKYGGDVSGLPAALGLEAIDVRLAGRGCVVMHPFEGQHALGLCLGRQSVFAGATGLLFRQTAECTAAWRP